MSGSMAAPPETVWVVIPAFDEAATIAAIVRDCLGRVDGVIVVDDGSADGTAALAEAAGATVLRHPRNLGKGASLCRGMRAALERGAARIATLDGDGQHRPEDLPLLLARSRSSPGSIVIGSRRADRHNAPPARVAANRIADFWVSWAARHWIEDSQSGFRIYPAVLSRELLGHKAMTGGFTFESEILIEAGRLGFRTLSVPIPAIYDATLRRPSHFRPVPDITRIVGMVALKLLRRGMDPGGLWRSLRRGR